MSQVEEYLNILMKEGVPSKDLGYLMAKKIYGPSPSKEQLQLFGIGLIAMLATQKNFTQRDRDFIDGGIKWLEEMILKHHAEVGTLQ